MNEPMELATRATSKSRTTVDSKAITSSLAQDVEPGDASEDASASNMAQQADTDAQDMRRMGRSQQFNRTFRQASITSFVALATASWEIGLFVVSPALVNGGRAGLVWSLLWNWVGFLPIYLSMVCLRQVQRSLEDSEVCQADRILVCRPRWLVWRPLQVPSTIGFLSLHQKTVRSS